MTHTTGPSERYTHRVMLKNAATNAHKRAEHERLMTTLGMLAYAVFGIIAGVVVAIGM